MRVSVIAAALAVVASARSLSTRHSTPPPPPACVETCLTPDNAGPCSQTDVACLCKNDDFIKSAYKCVKEKCHGDDVTKAAQHACAECANFGVTLPEPICLCKHTTA